ncbi:MAG: aspartate/glutamate racemase family protein [Bacteroidales bacterium]|nr:aspartate/glutamate racemase family protein [Bacteroidales bacterium]
MKRKETALRTTHCSDISSCITSQILKSLCLCLIVASCSGVNKRGEKSDEAVVLPAIAEEVLDNRDSYYYINTDAYRGNDRGAPVGIFDSGTGGLTILEAILSVDEYDNLTRMPGSDGLPDLSKEWFIYLADQANMPYGNYSAEGNNSLLVEHIIKDVHFLMSDKYYPDEYSILRSTGKEPAKTIVVACNTATAYGMPYINEFIRRSGTGIGVIGVIDAGVRGALQLFNDNESGSIGVLATVGTIASGGYENTIRKMIIDTGHNKEIQIFNQAGQGMAEAVDGERDFIDKSLDKPRSGYRGPSLTENPFKIEKSLMAAYNFNFEKNNMLYDSENPNDCSTLQINNPDNYMRFHIVSLLETMRNTDGALPLKVIILGCTHYPYLTNTIKTVLGELYNYRQDGEYRYRPVMSPEIHLIDPSVNVAIELFNHLTDSRLYAEETPTATSEFYISVPNSSNPNIVLDENKRFTYEYKYGRTEGANQVYIKEVPFSRSNISDDTFERLATLTPYSFGEIVRFHHENGKSVFIADSLKLKERAFVRY